jgi:hypothetical protein
MDIAQFGASGAVVAVVLLFLKFMREEGAKRDISAQVVAKALDKLSSVTAKNTAATIQADTYLKQRNGRDNEQHGVNIKIQQDMVQQIQKIPDIIYSKEKQRSEESRAILAAAEAIPITLKKIADDQAEAIIKAVKTKDQYIAHQQVAEVHIANQKVDNVE